MEAEGFRCVEKQSARNLPAASFLPRIPARDTSRLAVKYRGRDFADGDATSAASHNSSAFARNSYDFVLHGFVAQPLRQER